MSNECWPGCRKPGHVAVIFAGDVDDEDQRLASRLGVMHPSMVIYSRRAEVNGVGGTPLLAQVVAFGITLDAGEGRLVDRWERMARLAHESYVRAHPDPGNPARLPWDGGLSEFHRESNVRQVITTLGDCGGGGSLVGHVHHRDGRVNAAVGRTAGAHG